MPSAKTIAFITNPASAKYSGSETTNMQAAAKSLGLKLVVANARVEDEFESAFETAVNEGADGIAVGSEAVFTNHPKELATIASRHRKPTIFADHIAVTEGGLISYGTDSDDSYRLVGNYAARVLKGEKPALIPVQQMTRTKFVINLKTAKEIGINIPPMWLSRADEVIE